MTGRFWQALRECASRAYGLQGAVAVDKYVQLCEDAIEGRACEKMTFDPLLSVVRLSCLPEDLGSCMQGRVLLRMRHRFVRGRGRHAGREVPDRHLLRR